MQRQSSSDVLLSRLQVVAAVFPLAFIALLFVAISALGLPWWGAAIAGTSISIPFVVGFAFIIFGIVGRARGELLRREARFRELLESAPDATVIVDSSGVIAMANDQASIVFGYAQDELVGHPVEILLPDALRLVHGRHRAAYHLRPERRPMGVGLQLSARRKDGSTFPTEISLSPIHVEGDGLVTAVVRDVTDRLRLEEEHSQLVAAREAERERERIGMDLHDGIIQSIYAVGLNLEAAAEDVADRPEEVRGRLDRAIGQLNDTISDIRSYILQLRPSRLGGDLGESLMNLAEEFRVNSLADVRLDISEGLPALPPEARSAFFHIAQEALANVRKHARATSVSVSLAPRDGLVTLCIHDNGGGFNARGEFRDEHRGLRNMASRAREAGGTLSIESDPAAGTTVILEIPVAVAAGESR